MMRWIVALLLVCASLTGCGRSTVMNPAKDTYITADDCRDAIEMAGSAVE